MISLVHLCVSYPEKKLMCVREKINRFLSKLCVDYSVVLEFARISQYIIIICDNFEEQTKNSPEFFSFSQPQYCVDGSGGGGGLFVFIVIHIL